MCLAVPAQIVSINKNDDPLCQTGKVNFSGVYREISLAYLPEAKENDFVIVHAGVALSIIDEQEAKETLKAFHDLDIFNQTL